MALDPHRCPSDPVETAEAYGMGTLSREDAAALEEHYFLCGRCLAVVEDVERYVRTMQVAARRLRAGTSVNTDRL